MGKFILCTGANAIEPYYFPLTNTKIYSLEELGYYLYHNIYTISLEDFKSDFLEWVSYELKREDLARRWSDILEKSEDIKDIVVSILCATDYFTKLELESLIKTIDLINGMSPIRRRKIEANNYLKYMDYDRAISIYEDIISREDSREFQPVEFGNILHNLAVAHVQVKAYERAEQEFIQAYALNKNDETIKEYFYLLKLQKKESAFQEEALRYDLSQEKIAEIKAYLEAVFLEAEKTEEYKKITGLTALKEAGKVGDYYYTIDTMIFEWKQKYKYGME